MHIPKLNEIHIKDLMSFQESVVLQMAAKQDEFYKEILRQIIKREPTIEDAKNITLAINPDYPNWPNN
jgi:pantothenate kinase type III